MKYNISKKIGGLVLGVVVTGTVATAQKYKTTESIRSQLINNSVPGLQYASNANQRPAQKTKPFTGSSLAHALRTGNVPGMRFAAGQSSAVLAPAITPAEKTKPLASEISAEQAKLEAEKKAAARVKIAATQEEAEPEKKPAVKE
jgi:hypothetical protein